MKRDICLKLKERQVSENKTELCLFWLKLIRLIWSKMHTIKEAICSILTICAALGNHESSGHYDINTEIALKGGLLLWSSKLNVLACFLYKLWKPSSLSPGWSTNYGISGWPIKTVHSVMSFYELVQAAKNKQNISELITVCWGWFCALCNNVNNFQ